MTQTFFLYIGGKWKEGAGEAFHTENPATGEVIGKGQSATKEQVDEAIQAASEAKADWACLPASERAAYLKDFEEVLNENKQELARSISEETGKPLWESHGEVGAMINKISISIESFYERTGTHQKHDGKKQMTLLHKPIGVLGVIAPFNFPGHLLHGQMIPALIAGNTVVAKASNYTPIVGEEIFRLWQKVDLPNGVINLIQGGADSGKALAEHPGLDGLFFTGSYKTGLALSRHFGNHPEKILALEMGGNNPLIVSQKIDPKAAAMIALQSAYMTAGQRCTCARRLIVVEGPETEAFLNHLKTLIKKIKVGSYLETPEPFMGPVISKETALNALVWQAKLKAQGADLLVPMNQLKAGFLTPGLVDVTPILDFPDEELFAPCLHLIRVKSLSNAIHVANSTNYGLSAGLISEKEEDYRHFIRDIKAGIVCWNSPTTGASSRVPFGGVGFSGNFRPGAYYTADSCAYPVVATGSAELSAPNNLPGITL